MGIKKLLTFVKIIKQTLNDDLISLKTTILDFDELRLKYEGVLVDCINTEILKNPMLSQSLFAILGTAGIKANPCGRKPLLP